MKKKIPAIKAKIGDWIYYTGALTFEDVANHVKRIDDELHSSSSLNEAIQRSLTDNYLSIKNYILNQEERFFNSIVLAVYDGDPNWIEVELENEGELFFDLGFLSLSGDEKIFPVDGQHRVEGIKAALEEDPNLKSEKISVIFIGHESTPKGMQKSRRLFNALNRYAKPVSLNDIVALDEDDASAISTRYLIEDIESISLFKEDRLIHAKQKALPVTNKKAFTSLITLYQSNSALLKYYYTEVFKPSEEYNGFKKKYCNNKERKNNFDKFIKFRPSNETIENFLTLNEVYWKEFINYFESIQSFIDSNDPEPARPYRNREDGGNILFRPIGILPFVEATLEYKLKKNINLFSEVFSAFKNIEYNLNQKPWINSVWNAHSGNMETSIPKTYIRDMLLFLVDQEFLNEARINKLKEKYADKISYEGTLNDITLQELLDS